MHLGKIYIYIYLQSKVLFMTQSQSLEAHVQVHVYVSLYLLEQMFICTKIKNRVQNITIPETRCYMRNKSPALQGQ